MTEHSEYVLEPLREGFDFTLYRGRARGGPMRLLAVAVADEQPSPQRLRRLEHEYGLARELDAMWAARPLELTRYLGRDVLILEDPGGEPLDYVVERHRAQPIDLARFLRIAVGLATALSQVHRQGLIHKDVKPANVLVDDTGHVWLTGFGIASRLPRERQPAEDPEFIAGSLPYMAPEQTGRMNRSIDSRSDLYALGVTFYELATGRLPFTASDPMEWVHCHIARQPVSPRERVPDLPGLVSAIIMKCLAKAAEERYQTAAGLERDLQQCLTEWETHRRIDVFPLGARDTPDRLLIPETLYGRASEINALLASFDRVVGEGRPELVLVSGYSGIGKSSVVNELHNVLLPPRAIFASGKFDQYNRDAPYSTLTQAFQKLIRPLLSKSEPELAGWRDALAEALGPDAGLITGLIPELKLIIGDPPLAPESEPQLAQRRLRLVFRRFIGVFAKPEHPLALFLDDLQWLDAGTLDLLEDLCTQPDVKHLMLVGAYRDNEVDAVHPLLRKLDAIRSAGAPVHEIHLRPLGLDDVERLSAETLRCDRSSVAPLALLLHEKTGGNPFFAIEFLYALANEELLVFDHAEGRWSWDLDRIHTKGYTDNVVDLMVAKLSGLRPETQAALRQLACVGSSAAFALLRTVCDTSLDGLHDRLWEAVRSGLVLRSEDSYMFQHDRIQEAAYSLVPEEARAEGHLRIGRVLLAITSPDKREEIIFDIVNQFNRRAEFIVSEDERIQVAELNLAAGMRARASTAYASALKYFIAGQLLLSAECWERRPDLIFQLEVRRAECEFLTGDLAIAAGRLEMLRLRAANTVELAMATSLGIDVYMTLGQFDRAVAICLDYLRHVGIDWPLHPTEEQVRSEYDQIWSKLGGRAIEEVIDFPVMTDPTSIATLGVLSKAGPPTFVVDPNLAAMLNFRAVSLSIEYGNNDGSCLNYVWMGMLAGPRFGDKDAFRFGQLGYELVEKCGSKSTDAGTYNLFATTIMPWTKHFSDCCEVMRQSIEVANGMGDLIFAAYSRLSLNTLLFAAGVPLAEVQSEAEYGLDLVRKAKFDLVIDAINPQLGLVRTLRGSTATFGILDHAEFDELQFEHHLASNPAMAQTGVWYWIRKLQARFFAGDFASAIEASLRARQLLSTSPFFEVAEYDFYGALARAACCISATTGQNSEHYDALKEHHRQLEIRAERCPENLEDRAALAGAELARLEGRHLDAECLYERAISSARGNGFVHNEAIAYEHASDFYRARGFDQFADLYLRNARTCYMRWGATGKLRQLDARYPGLIMTDAQSGQGAPPTPKQWIDDAAIVKALQTLSGEILLPNLIERLMKIALQTAGAERGVLILIRHGEPHIEAEATTAPEKIEVAVRQALVTPSDLPQTALHYLIRTQERVLLDDASADGLYSKDEYITGKRSKSVMCLPIVRQANLTGVLYLENNLTPGAFTPDRVAVLELIAAQAAIALENAALYADLHLQVGLLHHLPVSAWTLTPDGTPDFVNQVWLDYTGQPLDFVRSHPEAWMTAVHPEDREIAETSFWEGVNSGRGFAFETRSLRAQDGVYRRHLQQAVVLRDAEGKVLRFVGTTTDIDDQKRAEDTLRQAQTDLARINRVTTMGELTASLAHELRQPISGAMMNANVCLRRLGSDHPDLDEVRAAATRIVRDTQRAAEMISRLRAQFEKGSANREPLDVNEINRETIALLRDEAIRYKILVRTELAPDLPQAVGDRVLLQQVTMNLILNGIEAMKDSNGVREMTIRSQSAENGQILVSVGDTGKGLAPHLEEQIFDPFFTTKPHGTGMGLRISRSIVESHGGRLWVAPGTGPGATFQFTLPAAVVDISAEHAKPIL